MVRAMWVVRSSITSPEKINRIIEIAKKHGFNALIVQVRGRGDAFYKSHYEPHAQDLTGQPNDFDPLQMILDKGKKADIQIHAWLNTYYTWGTSSKPVSPNHIVNKHPDWLMKNRQNEVTMTEAGQVEGAYTCPSNPDVKEHVTNCFLDVAKNYDIDGIHLDFVRYPSGDYCYCDGCLSRFKEHLSTPILHDELLGRTAVTDKNPGEWDNWRRMQVTELVSRIYEHAKALKPNLIVSAAVFPNAENAYNTRFQDWRRWLNEGYLDLLCPMAYSTDTSAVVMQISDAVALSNGKPVWAGIGAWRISPEDTAEKIEAVKSLGVKGFVLFSYGGVTNEGENEEYLRKLLAFGC